jgi:alpha-methylacyl-CoA racemase
MGPLRGVRVIELQGIGPGPFCGMMLADMGADVVRVDRASEAGRRARADALGRGRRSIAVDLKSAGGVATTLALIARGDVLIEGFRPGVMERLGLGPDACLARNPRLVYGRMTGWGQHGSIAHAAGHDINYIALTGALHAIGERGGKPLPPLNLVGDFGGGGMLLAFGIVAALFERASSGRGQVIDAAMTDGSALLMNGIYPVMQRSSWRPRGNNLLDGGAHFYGTYETRDGKYVSIGSLEPQFYALLLEKLGLDGDTELPAQMSQGDWPRVQQRFAAIFRTRTRDEWDAVMLGSDVCYAPVLDFAEAQAHPHNVARGTFVDVGGITQAAPAPRFDRTPPATPGPAVAPGQHTDEILAEAGFDAAAIARLRASGAVA